MKRFTTFYALLFFMCFISFSVNAQQIILDLKSGVSGSSQIKEYKNKIDILSFSHDMSVVNGKTKHGSIELQKELDNSSTIIMKRMHMGFVHKVVDVIFIKQGSKANSNSEYLKYTLKNAKITSHNISSTESEVPMESLTLSYESIEVEQSKIGDQGKPEKIIPKFTWNLKLNKP